MSPRPGIPPGATLELDALTRRFGDLTAVDGLTLDVRPGELFGVVGPDGAGKTTTLRMLAGVLRPTSGTARVDGVDVAARPEAVKPSLAYMPQRFGLYEDLTVRENLAFYADLHRVPRAERPARLERLYRFSRLREFEDRLAGRLSGGMKQKLSLSCCLIHRPRLLLLDEPTFGVDPISRRELWVILHEMVAEGITVVVSTSYLDEAERCDRVVLLDRGRSLDLDTPDALQTSLDGTLVEVRAEDLRGLRNRLRADPCVAQATLFGDALHALLAPGATVEELREALGAAGAEERDGHERDAQEDDPREVDPRDPDSERTAPTLREIRPSLEDVFLYRLRDQPAGDDDPAAPANGPSPGTRP